MKIIKKIINKLNSRIKSLINKKKFQKDLFDKVPLAFHEVAKFSYQKKLSLDERSLGHLVESFRKKIVSDYEDQTIETFGSPHSKSELFDEKGKIRPGDYAPRPSAGVARTGTAIFGGLQLKKIVEGVGGGRIIELGTNTGLSGCYFLSSNMPVELVTVEGSMKLCKIAEKNLINISNNFQVLNQMFDDALSDLINKKEEFDIGFVDGQHEKKATLFYARELKKIVKPGGIIIFDDIYWSEDMNNGWNDLIKDKEFSATIDLGNRGICVLDKEEETKKHFCLGDYIGNPLIYRSGW
jgi:SAM-dependent methyltransferase